MVFATMMTEFGNQTVVGFHVVRECALSNKRGGQHVRSKTVVIMSGVFIVFVFIRRTSESGIVNSVVSAITSAVVLNA